MRYNVKTKIKAYWENNKRKIILGIILTIFIFVFLFIRDARHRPDRSTQVDNTPQPTLAVREDMSGKNPVTLGSGTFTAGIDIPIGRYLATTTENSFGSVVVYELGTSYPEISEVLGNFSDTANVPSIALTLVQNQKIEITGLNIVHFTPLQTELKTELTTGEWDVGLDIAPGTYTISSKDGLSGSVTILDGNNPVGYAKLGNNGTDDQQSAVVTLKQGQIIRISNIPTVVFQ